MADGLAAFSQETTPRLAQALGAWDRAAEMGADLRDRVAAAKTSWLVAEPVEPLGAYDVTALGAYRVVASDGSQILPDRHERLPCYLLNTGIVDIDYTTASASLASVPAVFWAPEDTYPLVGGIRQEADGRVVGARRFASECDALRDAIEADTGGRPVVALTDGTLLLWWLEPDPERLRGLEPDDLKTQTFGSLRALMQVADERGAGLAGYLSSPRSTDVVSMLKVVLCTETVVDCDHCPYDDGTKSWRAQLELAGASVLPVPSKPCEEADPLTDASIFWSVLEAGQRSNRYRSAAKVSGAYACDVDFVYLHTGAEIARVEFPASTTPKQLDVLLGAVVDQSEKGRGYPVALAEAHEQAVVRAADRRAFEELVRRLETTRGSGMSRPSAKLARKRTSVL